MEIDQELVKNRCQRLGTFSLLSQLSRNAGVPYCWFFKWFKGSPEDVPHGRLIRIIRALEQIEEDYGLNGKKMPLYRSGN